MSTVGTSPTVETTPPELDETTHIYRREDIAKYKGTGTPITALCGHTQPVEDFRPDRRSSMCTTCRDIAHLRTNGSPGSN